jgi:hypothetical protein
MTAPSLLSPPARVALRGQVMMLMHPQPTMIAVLAHRAHGAAAIAAGLARGRTDADGAARADANAPSPPLCQSSWGEPSGARWRRGGVQKPH